MQISGVKFVVIMKPNLVTDITRAEAQRLAQDRSAFVPFRMRSPQT